MYSDWVQKRQEAYRAAGISQLKDNLREEGGIIASGSQSLEIRAAKWELAVDFQARNKELDSRIHAVERIPSGSRGQPALFFPIRFIFTNKLTQLDKLLIAFDALILSETIKREIGHGKIIHGDDFTAQKVKTSALMGAVGKVIRKISALMANSAPPDLVLNRHCAECEHQTRCREKAIEKDDLSLLGGMTEKERKKLNSKGIFTVTHLSYTFRPRRRPKKLLDRREKYHYSLKALAIRENKIHIVGKPDLQIEGTLVYLDVEGLPDRDFYYLIGARVRKGESVEQFSLWADKSLDEGRIWNEFLSLLDGMPNPVLICYGSYETTFLKTMCGRYGGPRQETATEKAIVSPINLLSYIYGRVYFPVLTNGLKEIAGFLGFRWSEELASGVQSIVCRDKWEAFSDSLLKTNLIRYNSEDCEALDIVTQRVLSLQHFQPKTDATNKDDVIDTSKMIRANQFIFKKNTFALPKLDEINKAAYWDYQRERIYLKSSRAFRRSKQKKVIKKSFPSNKVIECQPPNSCPRCCSRKLYPHGKATKKVIDLKFTKHGIKRWITQYRYKRYICRACGSTFYPHDKHLTSGKYGSGIMSYSIYLCIDLHLPIKSIDKNLNKLFDLELSNGTTNRFKSYLSKKYENTYNSILDKLLKCTLIHADETKMSVTENECFVWAFANMEEVLYVSTRTREGDFVRSLLKDFKGVLVSDFYAAYDGIDCQQQKCLIHLIRDVNDALYKHPYDDGLKRIAEDFTNLLKPIIETVDHYGLKNHFLKKHLRDVNRYYKAVSHLDLRSDVSLKLRDRLERNREQLFTFLSYDGVPWNNNNAEHAIKAFAILRNIIKGVTTEKGLHDYLILLSICQTCKYKGLDFFDFLRSGEMDIDVFATSQRKRRGRIRSGQISEVFKTSEVLIH